MPRITDEQFFARRSDEVAKDMLGRTLVTADSDGNKRKITLTEIAAYEGATKTTSKNISSAPGIASISTKFGQKLIDIATGALGQASCITIRGGVSEDGARISGPGNVSKALGITKQTQKDYEFAQVYSPNRLYLEGEAADPAKISVGKGNSDNCIGFYRL
jgi:3-methyladenine DNA glycosylase Mpg